MRQNRASKQNRKFLTVTMLVGFILLVAIGSLWTIAFENDRMKEMMKEYDKYVMKLDQSLLGDSLRVDVNDSTVYFGRMTKEDMEEMHVKGNNMQNMISVTDFTTGKTINENLPLDSVYIVIVKDSVEGFVLQYKNP